MSNAERTNVAFDASFFEEGWGDEQRPASAPARPPVDEYWMRFFREEDYDWDDPEWNRKMRYGKHAWRKIQIFQQRPGSRKRNDVIPSGYFMAVSPKDYERLTTYPDGTEKRWTLIIHREKNGERIVKIYARRAGRNEEKITVYAHREVLGPAPGIYYADHFNGWGLDNRRENLGQVKQSENISNSVRTRKKNLGLPPGVEPRKYKGGVRYGGSRRVRVSKTKVICIRSKRTWKTPEPASRWYQNQLKKMYGTRKWATNPTAASYPLFPPRLETTPSKRSARLRNQNAGRTETRASSRKERKLAELPF